MKTLCLFLILFSFVGSLFSQSSNPPNMVADSAGYSEYHYADGVLSGVSNIFYIKNSGGSGIINVTVKANTFTENKQFTVNGNARYKLTSEIPAKDKGYKITLNISASFESGITLSNKIPAYSSISTGTDPITIWHNVDPTAAPSSTLEELSPLVSASEIPNINPGSSKCYPNPFKQTTTISFSVPSISFVSLKILDLSGKDIETIVFEKLPAGDYTRQWNAAKMRGGIYFYRLQIGEFTETKKLNLIR